MPQQLADLHQRCPATQQLARRRVPEPMRGHLAESGALAGRHDDLRDPGRGQRRSRRPHSHEHLSRHDVAGTAVTQIRGQRFADIAWQRQPLNPRSLATHQQLAGAPLDVVQPQPSDLAAAHPQPHEQQQDREIPAAVGRAGITARNQRAYLISVEPARQPLKPPERDRRHHLRQRPVDQPLDMQEHQQRPQPRHHQLRRPPRPALAVRQHEPEHVLRRQPGESQLAVLALARGNERTDTVDIAARGAGRHTPLDQQILAIALKQQLDVRERRPISRRNDAKPAQIGKQRHQPVRDPQAPHPAEVIPAEPLKLRLANLAGIDPLLLKPSAQMRKQPQLNRRRVRPIPDLHKPATNPAAYPASGPATRTRKGSFIERPPLDSGEASLDQQRRIMPTPQLPIPLFPAASTTESA